MLCPSCGQEVPEGQKFCGACASPMPVQPPPSSEQIYFQDETVTVTRARAVLGDKTFAMSNVTSVAVGTETPSLTPSLVLVAIGVVAGICVATQDQVVGIILGALFLISGIAVGFASKPTHIVKLGSASGEQKALTSTDRAYIEKVVAALNQAIVDRG